MRFHGPVPFWAATHTARFATGQLEKSTVTFPTPAVPTVRVSGVERWPAPPVPSTVKKYVPVGTAPPTFRVNVELVPVGAAGLNEPVIPEGAPLRLKVTAPVKLVRVRLTVVVPVAPGRIVSADGERDSPRATIAEVSSGSRVVTKTWNANVVTVVDTSKCHVFGEVDPPDGSTAPLLYKKNGWLLPVNASTPSGRSGRTP